MSLTENEESLRLAIANEHVDTVKHLLSFGTNPNITNNEMEYPIFLAFKSNDILKLLINHKETDLSVTDKYRRNIYHYAADYNNVEIVQLLFDRNITNFNRKDVNLTTPVSITITTKYYELAKLFINHGATIDIIDMTMLITNGVYGDDLLFYLNTFESFDDYGIYNIVIASIIGDNYNAFELIASKYDTQVRRIINTQDNIYTATPLKLAVSFSREDKFIIKLLDYGANIDEKDMCGDIVLQLNMRI